ncbi:pyruvate phosphate dikinase PEP/pyruvate- binding protein [Segniliparus rotundus DSM 44985]|uniref:Pyruvate phosphate dikinase PEP/pyruvate-binding protein n=1 Tax=Segniliparus rotundus (strain ATCC BAA-972 / CDC 1076 / CIP 108378 / DSM 44985 / JCM 13578) TaxID=640132 RepID=D6Z783_SEGRD|nr:PEP/pyruvate-binding domain-containing protein [Segniliparus rotundus]ADG97813.1 pyruvate phosphate dikinase PEP/pyruvate- binding protein [Segniliparus rotundus DSM 44985]
MKFMFLGSNDFSAAEAGTKAAALHELAVSGFHVPPGFVLAPGTEAPDDAQLQDLVGRIGGFPVAVRSSGAAEDLDDASFAGMYESYLNVQDVQTLRQRIADCRESAHSARAAEYSSRRGHGTAPGQLSVLVQRQVDARIAGVGFTIDPLRGVEDFGVVEYCNGLGERLVSGHVTGSRLSIRLRDGEIVERCEGSEPAVCSAEEAAALAALMLAVQAQRGRPQDIEWAIATDGAVWLLQARPITAISWRTDCGQYTDADFRDGGVSARVCTPMMYSLYRNAFQSTMQQFFVELGLQPPEVEPEWIGMFYGRPYWNVAAVKNCFAKVPGWSEREFDADLGVNKAYGPEGPVLVPTTVSTVVRAVPVALAAARLRKGKLVQARRFAGQWPSRHGSWRRRIDEFAQTSDSQFARDLAECLLDFHPATEQMYFGVIYNNTVLQSDFKKLLDGVDAATGGTSAVTDLIGGLADISHMDMQRGIVGLHRVCRDEGLDSPAAKEEFAHFLDRHGFHADIELELMCPRWSEEPDRLRAMIRSMLESGVEPMDPDASVARQRQRYDEARAEVLARARARPLARLRYSRSLKRMLDQVRRYLVAREAMRELSAQAYAVVRSYLVEAGSRLAACGALGDPDDVFMLSASELADLAAARLDSSASDLPGSDVAATVRYRRALYDGYRDCEPPHELGSGVQELAARGTGDCLTGLGCSPGQVEGTARVVHSLREIDSLRAGDILVTQYTDPGWTPALGLVSGVVTQVGGMLSHAAVISREYGIPAVLNVANATSLIRSGQQVRIDGRAGTVELLDHCEEQVAS